MLSTYGVPFLHWFAEKVDDFSHYLNSWIDLLDPCEDNW